MIYTEPGSKEEMILKRLNVLAKKYPQFMPDKQMVLDILSKTPQEKRIEVLSMLMTKKLIDNKIVGTKFFKGLETRPLSQN